MSLSLHAHSSACLDPKNQYFPGLSTTVVLQKDSKRAQVLHRTTYCCCHGPEDHSRNIPADSEALPRPKGTRRKLTEWGGGLKVGCQAAFTAVIYIAEPQVVEIQYTQQDHVNEAGHRCHDENCGQSGRYLSVNVRQEIEVRCL